jgi:peptidoglycan/xylan/chitin deacetylase (PgdA/CDA1 family)
MTATPAPATPTADNAQIAARSHIPILCYHHIRAWQRSDTAADKPYIMPVPKFIAQLDYLQTNGYTTISPDQLVAYLRTGAPVPPKPIILTFDDGDSNQWTVALPELRKRHFTAMFFIMTVTLDKANYLSSDQIKALDRMGMTIAAHTWDHHRVDRYSGEDWERQISTPTKRLAEIVGHPIRYFAYPFGLWNTEAFPHLQDAGFDAAFQLADKIDPHTPLYTIRRAIANSYWTLPQFVTAITTWF